jgi:hypothetical protein
MREKAADRAHRVTEVLQVVTAVSTKMRILARHQPQADRIGAKGSGRIMQRLEPATAARYSTLRCVFDRDWPEARPERRKSTHARQETAPATRAPEDTMFKECLEEYASGSSEDVMDELLPRFKIVSDMRCRDLPSSCGGSGSETDFATPPGCGQVRGQQGEREGVGVGVRRKVDRGVALQR